MEKSERRRHHINADDAPRSRKSGFMRARDSAHLNITTRTRAPTVHFTLSTHACVRGKSALARSAFEGRMAARFYACMCARAHIWLKDL